jgi:hypothetical protein
MSKYLKIIFCILFSLMGFHLFAQNQKLVKVKVADKIVISVPQDFMLMPEEAYTREYGAYRPALGMYTSPNGEADLGINMTVNRSMRAYKGSGFKTEDLEMLKGMYKGSIAAMHSEVDFIQDKVVTINKRDYIVIEFVGTVKDENSQIRSSRELMQYSYLQYTIEDERVLIFNFTCPYRQKERWQATAEAIMQSAKVGAF